MRKLIKSAFAALLALSVAAGCANDAGVAAPKTTTQLASRGDLVLGLSADGRVALPVSNMNFGVSGTVSKIYVSVGDSVKAGDLLAELDDSSYQFAIESARNNLVKTQTSYDNAVSQYEYALLSDEKELKKLQRTITDGFDGYTYEQSIADAKAALAKKREDLEKAEKKAGDPFDPYTYDNQIAEAEKTLASRKKSLDEAEAALSGEFDDYSYQNSIADAKTSLERQIASLAAVMAEAGEFDGYSYENRIAAAEVTLSRKKQEHADAERDYNEALAAEVSNTIYTNLANATEAYNKAQLNYEWYPTDENQKIYDTAKTKLTEAENAYNQALSSIESAVASALGKLSAARNAAEDAQKSLDNEYKDYERAMDSHLSSVNSKIESAAQNVEDAERKLARAEEELSRAKNQNEKNYESAMESYESAKAALEKSMTDRERAEKQALEDAEEQLKNAVQAVTDAEVSLEKAETNLSRAKSDYARQVEDTLLDLQLKQINADMNKNSNASISNAEFALQEAILALEEAEANLDQVKLYAPIDGQILNISQGVGERVTAQQNQPGAMIFGTSGSGSSFLTLCDVTQIYLTASVTEGDVVNVADDQLIQVTIDAIADAVFYGMVTNIDNIPTTDQNGITTYKVTCLLDDTSGLIRDGMNAYITFVKRENKNVLLIPNKAVFMEEELQYVNVLKPDGTYEKRKVVCGLSNGRQTEVTSGLSEGETVLVGRLTV